MLLAYSTLWRDKLRPEVRVRAALFSDNSALCALRSALSMLVSALIGKRFDRISAAHPPVPSCSVSLPFSAPPLSGESGRAREPDDVFRDRARRSHAGQYLYCISRGAVPRRNRKSSLSRPAFVGRKRTSAGAERCISGSGAAQSRGSIPVRYQPRGCTAQEPKGASRSRDRTLSPDSKNKKPRRARQRGRKDSAFVYCRIRKNTTDITSSNTRKTIVSFFRMLSRLLDLFLPA